MTSLPLVSSTYGLVFSVYANTKDTHPYIKSVCEAAEQGVRSITSVVFTTASPIIDKLEPQSKDQIFKKDTRRRGYEVYRRSKQDALK